MFPIRSKKFSFPHKFQQLFLLFIYFSHFKIWKILGCDRLPPLKGISSRYSGRLKVTSWLQHNLGTTTLKRFFTRLYLGLLGILMYLLWIVVCIVSFVSTFE